MRVVAGQRLLDKLDEAEITFDIEEIIIHPKWEYVFHFVKL